MLGINYFGTVDYIVVAATLLLSLGIGVYYACVGKQTNEEMLVGGRSMSIIPIAASMLVTYLSAITILGYPAEVYAFGIQIFMMTLMSIICIPLSTVVFVKVFYKMRITSVYEYLEMRFESVVVRWLASFTFILQVLLINGVVLYAPAIALYAILGLPVWMSVVGIGIIGTVYTSIGGIKAVVFTDCLQFVMIIVGMVSIMVRGFMTSGGLMKSFQIAEERGRMVLFDFTFDPFQRHNFWNFLFGFGFTITSLYGTHQPQVQRYCSLPSVGHAVKALLLTIPFSLFTMALVILTGISVFAKYSGCCPILLGKIHKADAIIPYFVVQELAFIPGLMGIFVSCIFSAVLSSISSTLNSLAAVTWEDFLTRIPAFRNLEAKGQTTTIRIVAVVYGVISMGLAFGAQHLGAIFQLTMTAVGATSGPLGGIFICALFMPIMNKHGAIWGMLAGLVSMSFVAVQGFFLQREYNFNPMLPTSLDECPEGTDFSNVQNSTIISGAPQIEWPEKLYTLSYIVYPFIGAIVTTLVGLLVSLITGGFTHYKTVPRRFLHPIMNYGCRKVVFEDGEDEVDGRYKANISHAAISSQGSTYSRHQTPPTISDKYPYAYEQVSSPPPKY